MRAMNTSLEGERGQAKTGPVLARRIIEIRPADSLAKPAWLRVRLSDSMT